MRQILPDFPKAKAYWNTRRSQIPDYLMVPMADGQVVRYVPDLPDTEFKMILESLERLSDICRGDVENE